jgi:hypothetical protein
VAGIDIIENNPKARTRRGERKNKKKEKVVSPKTGIVSNGNEEGNVEEAESPIIHPENEKNISRANLPSQNIEIHAPIYMPHRGQELAPRQDGKSVPKPPTYTISEHGQLVFS